MDYAFLGKDGEKTHPIPIARDSKTSCTFATWVPSKGTSQGWVVKRILYFINGLGYPEVIVKSDQEPSIEAVQEAIKMSRKQDTMLDTSPVGESRSNGLTEKTVQEVTGIIRTYLDQAEDKLNVGKPEESQVQISGPLLAWLIEHAAAGITRAKIGIDGKTP